jgi:phosphocarrier protein HPr
MEVLNEAGLAGSDHPMKRAKVIVPWTEGLHLRRAAQLVKVAQRFRSNLQLKCGGRIADLRSIVSVLALCASLGTVLELEVTGEDEREAAATVEQVFEVE